MAAAAVARRGAAAHPRPPHKALTRGERLLVTPSNTISLGMTLGRLAELAAAAGADIKMLGSMLFTRCVSGTRVLVPGTAAKSIAGFEFRGFGTHCDAYPAPYLTAAAAIGMKREEVDLFIVRLGKAMAEFEERLKRSGGGA